MSLVINVPVDELLINAWIDEGFTSVTLWYSNTPDGVYANTGVSADQTLAAAITAESYSFEFDYSAGTSGMWFKVRAYDGAATYSSLNDSSPFHAGGGTTLAYVRQKTGELINDLVAGTTTSAGNVGKTTAICTSIDITRWPDDYFNDWFFTRLDTGETMQVQDFEKATGTITFYTASASQVGSAVSFELTKRWTQNDYRKAINWAIVTAYPVLNHTIVNTSLRTAEDIFRFAVPQDIRKVAKVEMDSLTSLTSQVHATRGHPWRQIPFHAEKDGLQLTLEFKSVPPYESGTRRIRVTGEGALSQVYNDSDTIEAIEPQIDLIMFLAAHRLWALEVGRAASTDRDFYQSQAKFYMSMYEQYKGQFTSGRPPRRIWSEQTRWGNTTRTGI